MIEYVLIAIVILVIFGTLYYYNNGKSFPPKSCGNCRFYDKVTGVCEISIYKTTCDQWDWNGERN